VAHKLYREQELHRFPDSKLSTKHLQIADISSNTFHQQGGSRKYEKNAGSSLFQDVFSSFQKNPHLFQVNTMRLEFRGFGCLGW